MVNEGLLVVVFYHKKDTDPSLQRNLRIPGNITSNWRTIETYRKSYLSGTCKNQNSEGVDIYGKSRRQK
jgi:hypothetical protein